MSRSLSPARNVGSWTAWHAVQFALRTGSASSSHFCCATCCSGVRPLPPPVPPVMRPVQPAIVSITTMPGRQPDHGKVLQQRVQHRPPRLQGAQPTL